MLKAPRKQRAIGPEDQGRRMTLHRFDRAKGREGYIYELVVERKGPQADAKALHASLAGILP